MTDEDRKQAMEWLDRAYTFEDAKKFGAPYSAPFKATIKAMLAEPRLPAEREVRGVIAAAIPDPRVFSPGAAAEVIYNALRDHLTKPKTKEVEVERWGVLDGEYVAYWARDEADAIAWATPRCGKYTVIRLAGKATVPA